MLSVNYVNSEDGGELKSGFVSSEQAEQYIQDAFCNGDVDEGDILQLLQDGEVVAEYSKEEFDC
jgi:hypothetical protein